MTEYTGKPLRVFWSWQSDRPRHVCRDLIHSALEVAVAQAAEDVGLDESQRPDLDHDVKGEVGHVDIAATILAKIEQASVFIADVTPISKSEADQGKPKYLPNPNVLIELGYAMHALGKYVILVQNRNWGGSPETLPFDLRHKLGPVSYSLGPNASEQQIREVTGQLEKELSSILKAMIAAQTIQADALIDMKGKPSRSGDPSVWFDAGATLTARGYHALNSDIAGVVHEGPRAYVRIIPAAWPGGLPTRARVESVSTLRPLGRWYGCGASANEQGVLALETADGRPIETAAQWFADTGEVWGFDAKVATVGQGDRLYLAVPYMLGRWVQFLNETLEMLSSLGASPLRRVEVGVVGLRELHWPGTFASQSPKGLDNAVTHSRSSRKWELADQRAFIFAALNKVRNAFGLPPGPESHIPAP